MQSSQLAIPGTRVFALLRRTQCAKGKIQQLYNTNVAEGVVCVVVGMERDARLSSAARVASFVYAVGVKNYDSTLRPYSDTAVEL